MSADIVVVGAGGHAKVCVELLRAMGEQVAWCVGDAGSPPQCLGVPVLVGDEHLASLRQQGFHRLFVAIGSNRVRQKLGVLALELGYRLVNAISPRAVVSPSARLGQGIAIMAGAVINAEAAIADFVIVNTGASVDHDCNLGCAAHVAPHCALAGNVTLGERGFLGVGASVIPGINIGADAIVGAGAVVVVDVGPQVTAVGVPAKSIKHKK